MTRYDPFSYGQVPLGQQGQAPATPDDILFAAPTAPAAPTRAAAAAQPAAEDADWAPVTADAFGAMGATAPTATPGATASAHAFGAEVLGEVAPAAAPMPRKPASAKPRTRAPKDPNKPKEALPRRIDTPLPAPTPSISALGVAVSTLFAAAGIGWASWLIGAAHNVILGGIVAAASVVGGAMGWLLLRR
jgi:hypothetical protein